VPTCLPPAPLLTEVLEAVTASTLNSDGLPVAGLVCVETMTEFVPERRWACEPGLLGILLWYRPGLFQCHASSAISGQITRFSAAKAGFTAGQTSCNAVPGRQHNCFPSALVWTYRESLVAIRMSRVWHAGDRKWSFTRHNAHTCAAYVQPSVRAYNHARGIGVAWRNGRVSASPVRVQ
jgi:hypothetical protein